MPTPDVGGGELRFEVHGDTSWSSVRLECDPAIPGGREFRRRGASWQLSLPQPPLDRIEYRFEVTTPDARSLILDPDNPIQVATVFGSRSVLELPGYQQPWWMTSPAVPGAVRTIEVPGERDTQIPIGIWSPDGLAAEDPAPLLVVHDGPEYARLAGIIQYSGATIFAGILPPHRLALATPVVRDAWYSASPRYVRSVADHALSRLAQEVAVYGPVAVMGASLGGLTSVLVGLLGAPVVGAVFSQSGSFFQPRHDLLERGFPWFDRITRIVEQILDTRHTDHPLRVGMTCGCLEENAANNRDMAAALRRAGHSVTYREVGDLHNYTAWRDALDPDLTQVLRDVWSGAH